MNFSELLEAGLDPGVQRMARFNPRPPLYGRTKIPSASLKAAMAIFAKGLRDSLNSTTVLISRIEKTYD